MFSYVSALFENPKAMIIMFLLAMPGRLLALSAHEFAHAFVADRCGDHTARISGRMTLNPLKHIDIFGLIMMLLVGFGWAKPVPVNPRNYRKYRRDDFLVSMAGITMNLILFIISLTAMYIIIASVMRSIASGNVSGWTVITRDGAPAIADSAYYYPTRDILTYPSAMADMLIAPIYGTTMGYLYKILSYFVQVNLVLAIFNLLPVPPLDGYHALNDLVLKRPLFASPRATQIASGIFFVLVLTGVVGTVINYVYQGVFWLTGSAASGIFSALGVL